MRRVVDSECHNKVSLLVNVVAPTDSLLKLFSIHLAVNIDISYIDCNCFDEKISRNFF
jgi:hypothetical protein